MNQWNNIKVVFFGNPEESVLVVEKIYRAGYTIAAVVTKPPQPIGRKQILTPTPLSSWAKQHNIVTLTFPAKQNRPWLFVNETQVTNQVIKYNPDILICADFTQKIPLTLIKTIRFGGLNIHPSLLPAYRGPAPIQWQILLAENQTGVSIVKLTEEFDAGEIIAQEKDVINPFDTTPILLKRLFTKGADLLIKTLPKYFENPAMKIANHKVVNTSSYFPRLTRDDGFIPWQLIKAAITNNPVSSSTMKRWRHQTIVKAWIKSKNFVLSQTSVAELIYRAYRAFHPWPGLWTKVKVGNQVKRLKLLQVALQKPTMTQKESTTQQLFLESIQLEGKKPIWGKDSQRFLDQLMQPQSS